jgi:hypothetical protein
MEAALAVWCYNMKHHIQSKHPYISLADYETLWKIGSMERKAMKSKWDDCKKVKKTQQSTKVATPLVVSTAYSSCLTLTEL